MTRDDAIAVVNRVYEKPHQGGLNEKAIRSSAASGTVDALVALGLLKLDEPKTVEDEARRWLHDSGHFPGTVDVLLKNGFKIVKA